MTLFYPSSSNALQKTLDSALDAGVTASATFNNTTGIQNKAGVFVVDRVDSNGTVKASSDWEWISFAGTSGSTVTTLVRGLAGSSDQDHAVGAIVEFVADVIWADGVMDALDNAFTAAGAVDTTKVVTLTGSQTLTNKTLTTPVIATISNTGTVTLPTATDTLVAKDTTDTLTNKRITKRVVTAASSATPTPDVSTADVYALTALGAAAEFQIPAGTPTQGQTLIIRIKDDGTGRALTYNAIYRAIGVTLPTTTVANKTHYIGMIYNSTDTKWDCLAVLAEA